MSQPTLDPSAPDTLPRPERAAEPGLTPPARKVWCSPASDGILSILFIVFLVLPGAGYFFGWKGPAQLHENRRLAEAPSADDPIEEWPGKLEAYYDDRFGFRADLVNLNALLLHKYLHAPNSEVLIGKEGWTFYSKQLMFEDFFGKSQFNEADLKHWKDYLERRSAAMARTNGHYLFVIAPDKDSIYAEYLPSYIQRSRGKSRLQQLKEYLKSTGSTFEILDLHDALLQAKSEGQLYYTQDAHWNGRGYYVAYRTICAALARWFPGMQPRQLGTDYTVVRQPWDLGDWSLLGLHPENLHYPSDFLVSRGTEKAKKGVAPYPAELPQSPDPLRVPLYLEGPGQNSLLVFHDSFMRVGTMVMEDEPIAEHFARTLLVGMQPTDQEFQLIVDKFHPDVVIEERAERFMAGVPR